MIRRVGQVAPLRRTAPVRRRLWPAEQREPEPQLNLAVAHASGTLSVEISQEAVDAYVDMTGDVPLPVLDDPETGDRRTYDARNRVWVVCDAAQNVREVATRSNDGLFVRINFTDGDDDGDDASLA